MLGHALSFWYSISPVRACDPRRSAGDTAFQAQASLTVLTAHPVPHDKIAAINPDLARSSRSTPAPEPLRQRIFSVRTDIQPFGCEHQSQVGYVGSMAIMWTGALLSGPGVAPQLWYRE